MGLIRAICTSKLTTLLSLVAALIGLLTQPEFVGLVPADWSAWLAGVGTFVAALSRGFVDADGDGIPDVFQSRRGNASLRMLVAAALVSLLAVAACAAKRPAPLPNPTPNTVSATMAVGQTTLTFSGACKLHQHASTCRWEVQRNGVAVPNVADGQSFSTTGPRPAPGDSVVYQVRMKWVNPAGQASANWSGWIARTHVEGFPIPPTPVTDSIINVIITGNP